MLSVLMLALGVGAPADGFVIPEITRPVPTFSRPAPLFAVPGQPPAEPRKAKRAEPADVVCAIRSIEAPPVDEEMARTSQPDVDRGMVVTSRCRAPESRDPEPRR